MLKSTVIGACLTLSLAVGVAAGLGGCATQPAGGKALAENASANNPHCITDTGTRIQDPDRKCVNQPGSAYTQQDLQQTGEIDPGAALKKLDPRIQ